MLAPATSSRIAASPDCSPEKPPIGAYMRARLALYDAGGTELARASSEVSKDMLDDMPKSQSVALTADPEDAIATMIRPPAKRRGRRVSLGGGREKVVRPSALGMLLKPIGIAVGIVLCVYAIVSLGTTFYRSYYRHLDHTAAVHADKACSTSSSATRACRRTRSISSSRMSTGRLHKVVASKSASRQIRQRHDPDARRGAGAHQAGGA